jgi:hypothetical protein
MHQAAVQSRGWEYPRVDDTSIRANHDFIESSISFDLMNEFWRFYQSGLFVWWGSIWSEWRDESRMHPATPEWRVGATLSVEDVVSRYSEIYEFAGRLAAKIAPNESIRTSVVLAGLKNRSLAMELSNYAFSWLPRSITETFATDMREFPRDAEILQVELTANSEKFADAAATELLKRFKFEAPPTFVQGIRQKARY